MAARESVGSIGEFVRLIPEPFLDRSGTVFLSGRRAFEAPSDLYILGLNPAGDPKAPYTVGMNIDSVLNRNPDNWSAYKDERWRSAKQGRAPMQRRVLHMLGRIGRDPGEVPASEVVFLRSTDWTRLGDFDSLAEACWPFHQAVIEALGVRVVACLGHKAGYWVRSRLNAHAQTDTFVEDNRRRWTSHTHRNAEGLTVVTLTHPSQAAWTVPESDPTGLVERALSTL